MPVSKIPKIPTDIPLGQRGSGDREGAVLTPEEAYQMAIDAHEDYEEKCQKYRDENANIDCWGTEAPVCPWCGQVKNLAGDDTDPNDGDTVNCKHCYNPFKIEIDWDPTYYTEKTS